VSRASRGDQRREPGTGEPDPATGPGQASAPHGPGGADSARPGPGRGGEVDVKRPAGRSSPLRIMVLFAVLTLLPLVVLTYAAITLSADTVGYEVRAQVRISAALEARAVAVRMDGVRGLVGSVVQRRSLLTQLGNGRPDPRDLSALQITMQQILQGNPGFASVAVLDPSGRLISVAPPSPSIIGENFSYRDWYKGVTRTGTPYVSPAYQSVVAGHPLVVAVAAPIRALSAAAGSAPAIGYLVVDYRLSAIQQFVTGFEQGQSVALTVTDQRGVILATPIPRPGLVSAANDRRVRRALAGQTGAVSVDANGHRVLSGFAPVGDLGWTVHADILEAAAFAGANRLHLTVTVIAGGLGLGLLAGALLLGRAWERAAAEAEVRALNADLETRVAQRTLDLQRANHNLEAFTYSVSHDLRSPLRAMSGFSEALAADYGDRLDEAGRDYLVRIEAASERMGKLIDDLLHLSRVSRAELHLEPVNLSAEVASIAADLQRREPDRRARFAIQDAVWVTADRRLIRTVVENLLENAWKFTSGRPQARIGFGTMPTGDGPICCYVRDNGAGFDPAYVSKLFQPFQRLHSATEFPGTGIGLASVQRIVERHGGRTWAAGTVDGGATFYFTIDTNDA
jgi:signal transduction histidine kinase